LSTIVKKCIQSSQAIKIAIVLGAPFTKQNYERIGVPYLSSSFQVVVYDCTEWLGRNTKEIKFIKFDWQNYASIKSEEEFNLEISTYRPDYVIDAIGYEPYYTEKILHILDYYRVRFVVVETGNVPTISLTARIKNLLLTNSEDIPKKIPSLKIGNNSIDIKKNTFLKLALGYQRAIKDFLMRRLSYRRLDNFHPFIGLLAGKKSINFYSKRCNPIIWVGSIDYHNFIKIKSELLIGNAYRKDKPYILFIADALDNANDWTLLGIPPPVTEEPYYRSLRLFFKKLELIYSIPVVIAAHPNSATDEKFISKIGHREVIFENTAALAIQASLVLVHGSTATSFAVLARKPILVMTTKELNQAPFGQEVKAMSRALGAPLIFIDREIKSKKIEKVSVNEKKYKQYEVNYLYSNKSKEIEPWAEFIKYINKNKGNKGET
jgi:hypothetical protein